jgi:predicted O-linked N-acetylglucosamine transferase (SPINDLY family)
VRTEARQFLDQANAFTLQRRFADAIPLYQRAIEADPADPRGFHQLGCMLYAAGQIAEARGVLDLGLSALPASPLLHWARCMATLPAIYADNTEIETVRAEFSGRLAALESVCLANLPEAAEAAGSMSPFFLAYQGRNDIAPMRIFGTLSCRIMAAAAPSFATRPMPRWQPGERIRVGFVCGLFFRHAVWRMPVRGWAENLDRSRFELTGYHTRPERDAQTDLAAGLFGRFDRTPRSALAWAASIAHDAPHVLIYPELGADQTSQQLAALRLAPVQCTTWGQPVTSGMPTMDYYLSSDLMEPACGQDHYTERLVRLPGLGIVCQADYAAWGAPLPRNDIWTGLDLPGGAVRFICCQSLPKYLPDFDDLYPRIAAALPAARFLFVATDRNHAAVLHRRLQAAFARHGLAADTFVRFAGTQSPEGFSAMIRDADVFLDTPVWSGCNTTFDAAGHGIPVVTLPGTTMRGRHSLAILSAAGVTETVASSLDDYAEIAVHLGRNEHWRRAVAARLRAARPRIFGDTRPVRALEDFLTAAVAAASQG